jgi:tight adherence protein C
LNGIAIIVLIIGVIVVGGVLVWAASRNEDDQDPMQSRLANMGDREMPKSLEELEMSLSFMDRVVRPSIKGATDFLSRFTPESQIEQTRRQLELAGKALTTDPRTFFGSRILLTIILGTFFTFVSIVVFRWGFVQVVLAGAVGAGLGYYMPTSQLKGQTKKRQDIIIKALPDALDLLCICVEAGLGFDQAMGKVYEKWDNELAVAFGRVLQEIALGKTRRDALRDMALSMDVPDVTSFTAAIIQADQLGVSMAKILRIQSEQMRIKRRQRAQEKAHQAPVKMMIPMVFLIFPSIWIVLMGPAAIMIIEMSTNSG